MITPTFTVQRSARTALDDAIHGETMQRLKALGQTRSPKSRTREADMPLGVVGTPIPLAPEPLS